MSRAALWIALAGVGLAACDSGPSTPASAQQLELIERMPVRERITDLTFRTPLVHRDVRVRVMTPKDYDETGRTRYPVIYLLHGAGGDHTMWTEGQEADGTQGQLQDLVAEGSKTSETEAMTESVSAIFVMPETEKGGGYMDWYNDGAFGPPAWESYHVGQLLPWIDAHYPTIGTRAGRAVAGFSMGGFGAFHYAARHPDRFVAVAGFSPAVDKTDPLVMANNSRSDPRSAIFGDDQDAQGSLLTNTVYIRGHNPMDLALNLRGIAVTVRCGNGVPGPPPPIGAGTNRPDPVEAGVFEQAFRFHNRLTELGIEHVWQAKAGAHTRAFAEKYLRETLPWLLEVLASERSPPPRFSYRSIDPRYEVYGWTVEFDRAAREFSELLDADRTGFELRGSGQAVVRTPAGTRASGRKVEATLHRPNAATRHVVEADLAGRLSIPIDLGPANPYDEFSPEAQVAGTQRFAVRVDLEDVAP